MFLFRSLTIGLLGACVMFLVRLEPTRPAPVPTIAMTESPPVPTAAATIVDVAPGVRGAEVTALIRLLPGERVVAVDDRRVETDLAAGAAISNRVNGAGGYVDLDIQTSDGLHRRVLVLLH
ncbi:MAG: hypothetical protein H0T46_25405 [Deltaproteobacteria bacterium]|nr:hypothetical protein [Deltaproteobacteria bacterium]